LPPQRQQAAPSTHAKDPDQPLPSLCQKVQFGALDFVGQKLDLLCQVMFQISGICDSLFHQSGMMNKAMLLQWSLSGHHSIIVRSSYLPL
jgi:hypothetical protein